MTFQLTKAAIQVMCWDSGQSLTLAKSLAKFHKPIN
jgi:hypothetical protein